MYDESRIQKIKKNAVSDIYNSKVLNELCKELWIFGSSIIDNSSHRHTPFSDLDIGIKSNDVDLDSEDNKKISVEIYKILKAKKIKWDIIWMQITDDNALILDEIKKGERII